MPDLRSFNYGTATTLLPYQNTKNGAHSGRNRQQYYYLHVSVVFLFVCVLRSVGFGEGCGEDNLCASLIWYSKASAFCPASVYLSSLCAAPKLSTRRTTRHSCSFTDVKALKKKSFKLACIQNQNKNFIAI